MKTASLHKVWKSTWTCIKRFSIIILLWQFLANRTSLKPCLESNTSLQSTDTNSDPSSKQRTVILHVPQSNFL